MGEGNYHVLSSYTVYSPSKLGVHILTRATLQGAGRKRGTVEMYATERYFTLTTDHVPGTPTTIEERQQQQTRLYTSLGGELPPARRSANTRVGVESGEALVRPAPARSDEDVVDKAQAARNGARFAALWQGDITGYKSKNEADFTLALLLLYWTNDDLAQTRRLFQQSGLYDEKTERPTGEHSYLDVTIYNALRKGRHAGH